MKPHSSAAASLHATLCLFAAYCVLSIATFQSAFAQSAPADRLKLPTGFKAELLYRVPDEQGSWVSITNDPQGRLIASDQHGKLYRITPKNDGRVDVEEIDLKIGFAQGLLCAFDSLYVISHGNMRSRNAEDGSSPTQEKIPSGL